MTTIQLLHNLFNMHWQAFQFVTTIRSIFPEFFINKSVLEVGSHCINGSVKTLFDTTQYLGIDLSEGECVDVIVSGHNFFSTRKFDVAISCECFEHNPFYHETLINMINHTKENGIIIFTCATSGRPEHGTTQTNPNLSPGTSSLSWDYYKNLTESDFNNFNLKDILSEFHFFTNRHACDLYFFETKSQSTGREFNKKINYIENLICYFEKIPSLLDSDYGFLEPLKRVDLCPDLLFYLWIDKTALINNERANFTIIVDKTLVEFPFSAEANYLKAELLIQNGLIGKALHFAKRATKYAKDKNYFLHFYATVFAQLSNFEAAIENLLKISTIYQNAPLLWKLSTYYSALKRYEIALLWIDKALDIDIENPIIMYQKKTILTALGRTIEAEGIAYKILQIDVTPQWIRDDCLIHN